MKTSLYTFIFLSIIFMSCGPNAQEKAAQQKIHDDSIALSTKNKVEDKIKIEEQISSTKNTIDQLKDNLAIAKGDAAAAKDKMVTIKEWQLGRTSSEREEQVKNQTIVIEEAERKIADIENAIVDAENAREELQLALKKF